MPPGELIALRWSDIDFESSSVKVTKSTCRTNGKMITKTTKTGATREIAVPELICKMARQWQIEQLRQQLMIGSKTSFSRNGTAGRWDWKLRTMPFKEL